MQKSILMKEDMTKTNQMAIATIAVFNTDVMANIVSQVMRTNQVKGLDKDLVQIAIDNDFITPHTKYKEKMYLLRPEGRKLVVTRFERDGCALMAAAK